MQLTRVAVTVSIVGLLSGLATASDWPTYMHDNTRVGHTADSLQAPLSQAWVYTAPGALLRAYPGPEAKLFEGKVLRNRVAFDDVLAVTVAGGGAYFGSSVDNCVYCVDPATGATRWSFFTDGPVRLAPTIWGGKAYFGSDDGNAYCVDASTGKMLWQLRAGPRDERMLARGRLASRWPVRTGVMIEDGVAYFGAGIFPHETVYLYAVDALTGKIVWKNDAVSQRDAGRDDLTPQGYLLANKESIFVPSGRSLPAAVSRATGEVEYKRVHAWRSAAGGEVGGTQLMLADDQVYANGSHHLLAMAQRDGDVGFGWFKGRQMTLAGDAGYMADGEKITAIDRAVYAKASSDRHELEMKAYTAGRSLKDHKALKALATVEAAQKTLAEAEAAQSGVAEAQKAVASAAKKYEPLRLEYEGLKAKIAALNKQASTINETGRRWAVDSELASALVIAGNTLIAGGEGGVAVFDAATGKKLWSQKVDGEAKGLAVADGRLYVSTTAGRIYCFADAAQKPTTAAVARHGGDPFPADDLTETYARAAEAILKETGQTQGYCLVLGNDRGRLAYELAKRSELHIYAVEPDAAKVAEARRVLEAAGLYGWRITVDHMDLDALPYPDYFANLIVSDSLMTTGELSASPALAARHLKPCGGVMVLGAIKGGDAPAQKVTQWLAATRLESAEITRRQAGPWTLVTRGKLIGSDGWVGEYGSPANTASNEDTLVRGGMNVLWYGDPGPAKMVNRHYAAVGPVSANGRLFIQGNEMVMAYDAYNGQFLWELADPGARRQGVSKNNEAGNIVATDDALFVAVGDKCLHLDAATGRVIRTYNIPDPATGDEPNREWSYIAFSDGLLYGTSTVRAPLAGEAKRRGKESGIATDKVFAIDTASGKLVWTYQGAHIAHTTIAIGEGRVYFIDSSLTPEQRDAFVKEDKTELAKLTGAAQKEAEARAKRIDLRRAVAVDAATGSKLWDEAVDVTDCTGVGIGAGQLTLMYSKKHVVLCGANGNGHYWTQFLAGDFQQRRIVVLNAENGQKVWAKDANYRHRPLVVGGNIVAEPWAFDLCSGAPVMRTHPLTGEQEPWMFGRPGHHCGAVSASPSMMFFRSGFTAFYDLENDSGTEHFAGQRLGCWINAIPANGLVLVPEASAGCVCLFSLEATIVFEPTASKEIWSVYTAAGALTPVRQMAVNLGAPGDRRDAHGTLWLSYPRPSSRPGLALELDLKPKFASKRNGFFAENAESYKVEKTDTPWLYASGAQGIDTLNLPLISKGQPAATYTVRLHFAAPEGDKPGQRVFDVEVQGKAALKGVDVAAQAGGPRKAMVLEVPNVAVTDTLQVHFTPKVTAPTDTQAPIISAIEVLREGSEPIRR